MPDDEIARINQAALDKHRARMMEKTQRSDLIEEVAKMLCEMDGRGPYERVSSYYWGLYRMRASRILSRLRELSRNA